MNYLTCLAEQKQLYQNWTNQHDFKFGNKLPWLKLSVTDIPTDEILKEFEQVRQYLVSHRDYEDNVGWESMCLHGIDVDKTNHWKTMYQTRPIHSWTSVGNMCPVTKSWIIDNFNGVTDRVRFMLLEPKGYISKHTDYPDIKLGPINISVTQPEGCNFVWEDWGIHPWQAGEAYLMNVHYNHSVVNNSNEERLHIIIDGYTMEDQLVKRSLEDALQSYNLLDN